MKKLILTLICFISIIEINAQDWQLVRSNKVQWFSNSNNYLKVIYIDSVKVINGDSIFYFPVTLGIKTRNYIGQDLPLDLKSPWWVGDKIILRSDGSQVFFNAEHDTLLMNVNKSLNDEWTFTTFSSGNYVKAKIIDIATDTVLGVKDSIKTIRLNVFSKSNTLLSTHQLNNLEIQISKNNGFIKVFPLFSVLDSVGIIKYEIGGDKYGIQMYKLSGIGKKLTNRDVYDFNKGDVFQIKRDNYGEALTTTVIKDKTDYGDSIKYAVEIKYQTIYHGAYSLDTILQQDRWIKNCKDFYIDRYPEQYSYGVTKDTVKYNFNEFQFYLKSCGLVAVKSYFVPTSSFPSGHKDDTVFYHRFEAPSYASVHGEHFGLLDSLISWPNGDPWDSHHSYLYGYKSSYCNFSPPLLGLKADKLKIANKLVPNPVSNYISLSSSTYITELKIFNALGQEIVLKTISKSEMNMEIDASGLKAGIYFIIVNSNDIMRFVKAEE